MKKSEEWYGEWVEFKEEERDEAIQYLQSWKKFILRKIPINYEIMHEQIIEKDPETMGPIYKKKTIGLKICVIFQHEVESIESNFKLM